MSAYEQCVLGSDGRCTRWGHDHSTNPIPRPAEGPDREALRAEAIAGRPAADLLAEVLLIHRPDWEAVCRGCSGGERWPCDTHALTEAAIALLPTPPAPGDGEGLRAEVDDIDHSMCYLDRAAAFRYRDLYRETRHSLDRTRAALAARDTDQGCTGAHDCPAGRHIHGCFRDTDQGAKDALAEAARQVRRDLHYARDGHGGIPFDRKDVWQDGFRTAKRAALRSLDAALARATPEAGE
jgi:hypothetical protein